MPLLVKIAGLRLEVLFHDQRLLDPLRSNSIGELQHDLRPLRPGHVRWRRLVFRLEQLGHQRARLVGAVPVQKEVRGQSQRRRVTPGL